MEQTTRKHSERAPAEQVEDTPEADASREAQLDQIDELLDEIDEILEDNEESVTDSRSAIILADIDAHRSTPEARLARVGLFGPSDLDEATIADLAAYAEELAAQEADELQAELAKYVSEQNPPCMFCGACPVLPGCPFQADGEAFYRDFDGTFISY